MWLMWRGTESCGMRTWRYWPSSIQHYLYRRINTHPRSRGSAIAPACPYRNTHSKHHVKLPLVQIRATAENEADSNLLGSLAKIKESSQVRKVSNVCHAGSLGDDLLERNQPFKEMDCEEIVLGIDPDRYGALAILKSTRRPGDQDFEVSAQVIDVPVHRITVGSTTKGRERIDAVRLAQVLKRLDFPLDKTVAFLEGGGVEYHFSSYSAFVQGSGVGVWEGILSYAGIQYHKVNSKTWKTLFGLIGTKKTEKVKASGVALARQIFPLLDDHLQPKGKHGRSDALLIASYGHLVRLREENRNSDLKETFLEAGVTGINSERLRLDLLTANELKLLLKARGLKISGKKGELIERLLDNDTDK